MKPYLTVVLMIVIAGCDTITKPSSSNAIANQGINSSIEMHGTYRSLMLRISEMYPSFSGVYIGDNNQVVINYAGDKPGDDIIEFMLDIMESSIREYVSNGVEYREVQYTHMELFNYYINNVYELVSPSRFVMATAIDEKNNVIIISFSREASQSEIDRIISDSQIPSDMLDVRTGSEGARSDHSLVDKIRPMAAGLLIVLDTTPSISESCTLGPIVNFEVEISLVIFRGFITNSHCTTNLFAYDGVDVYQNSIDASGLNKIGSERINPPSYPASHPGCIVGRLCRVSDAALFTLREQSDVTSLVGRVFETVAPMNLNIPNLPGTSNPRSVSYFQEGIPMIGTEIYKTGMSSGTTAGKVIIADQDIYQPVNNTQFIHQVVANYVALEGDSGSPVTSSHDASDVSSKSRVLYGMHWGASPSENEVYFSTIDNIELDLGYLRTYPAEPLGQ